MNQKPEERPISNCFITILDWMVNPDGLNLKGTDLLVYAVIYGFSQGHAGIYKGGAKYLAYWCNSSTDCIYYSLQRLVESGTIQRKDTDSGIEYTANPNSTPVLKPKEVKPQQTTLNLTKAATDLEAIEKYDWLGLVLYFEKNRRDKKGKAFPAYLPAGRVRQAKQLEKLSEGCWSYAVDAVNFALDNNYQGFANGEMYFRGDLGVYKAREQLEQARGQNDAKTV